MVFNLIDNNMKVRKVYKNHTVEPAVGPNVKHTKTNHP